MSDEDSRSEEEDSAGQSGGGRDGHVTPRHSWTLKSPRFDPDFRDAVREAARASGKSQQDWIADALLAAARGERPSPPARPQGRPLEATAILRLLDLIEALDRRLAEREEETRRRLAEVISEEVTAAFEMNARALNQISRDVRRQLELLSRLEALEGERLVEEEEKKSLLERLFFG